MIILCKSLMQKSMNKPNEQMKNGIGAMKHSFLKTKHVTERFLEAACTDEQLEKITECTGEMHCQSRFCSRFPSRPMLHGSLQISNLCFPCILNGSNKCF